MHLHSNTCFSYLVYNISMISCRIVRMTSPNLNYFIAVGALLLYTSVYVGVLHTTDETAVKVHCIVSIQYATFRRYSPITTFTHECFISSCSHGSMLLDIYLHLEPYSPKCGEFTTSFITLPPQKR